MRKFNYTHTIESLLVPDIINLLSAIHEQKGRQERFLKSRSDLMSGLLRVARIQSTQSSNRIEGIQTSDARIAALVQEKAQPQNRDEKEIAGYRDVLAMIHENNAHIPITSNVILQLHRDLFQYSGSSTGGSFKSTDNLIEEIDTFGKRTVRFLPLSAIETPEAIQHICDEYHGIETIGSIDPLLVFPIFILDFLCIHPFNDGNGRLSRLLTLLMLYRAGYVAGKYISIEMIIEKTKESYYDALQVSSVLWHEGTNDYKPFTRYTLGVILNAYKDLSNRLDLMNEKGMTAAQRVSEILRNQIGVMTKKEIAEMCPDLNPGTIERAITKLSKAGEILKIGGGRFTSYTYNREPSPTQR